MATYLCARKSVVGVLFASALRTLLLNRNLAVSATGSGMRGFNGWIEPSQAAPEAMSRRDMRGRGGPDAAPCP